MEFTQIVKTNKVAFEHARQVTAHYSKSFYLSTRLLPERKQWATYALYGFCRYADNLIDNPRQRSAGELQRELSHLAQELTVAYRTGESEHPILQPFILTAREYDIPEQYPQELLQGVEMDLRLSRYPTFDDLFLFAYRVAGVVGIMMTYVLGYRSEDAFHFAEQLGIAMQLTNILRDIKEDARRGRIYLPQEEITAYHLGEPQVTSGVMSDQMREFMRFQVRRAHQYYEAAEPGIRLLDKNAQFAIYAASKIYRGILSGIETRDYNPFLERVHVPKTEKLQILIREVIRTRLPFGQRGIVPVNT